MQAILSFSRFCLLAHFCLQSGSCLSCVSAWILHLVYADASHVFFEHCVRPTSVSKSFHKFGSLRSARCLGPLHLTKCLVLVRHLGTPAGARGMGVEMKIPARPVLIDLNQAFRLSVFPSLCLSVFPLEPWSFPMFSSVFQLALAPIDGACHRNRRCPRTALAANSSSNCSHIILCL